MIKIENFKTFTDIIIPEAFIIIDGCHIHNTGDGFVIMVNFKTVKDVETLEEIEGIPDTITIPYDINSDINPIKAGYAFLSTLDIFKNCMKV